MTVPAEPVRYGDRALLMSFSTQHEVVDRFLDLQVHQLPGQVDTVAADHCLMVQFDSDRAACTAIAALRQRIGTATPVPAGEQFTVDVVYDGADLDQVGELTGLGRAGVVQRHTSQPWTVAFTGFLPGFAYLVSDAPGMSVPRRSSPRTRIPAGSVALAADYSAIYPASSPGGWQLIGRSSVPLWNVDASPPATLGLGMTVRFRSVTTLPGPPAPRSMRDEFGGPVGSGLRIERPGVLSLVMDEGRPGYASMGVPESGAADRSALRVANELVGNPAGSAALETVLGGLVVTAVGRQVVAVSGAAVSIEIHRRAARVETGWSGCRVELGDGDRLRIPSPPVGLRSYLAVLGGVTTDAVLGSRSSDVLSGIGPRPLRRGDLIATGAPHGVDPVAGGGPRRSSIDPAPLVVRPGPHLDSVAPQTLSDLTGRPWTVSTDSNRTGIRLSGAALRAEQGAELRSAPLVAGAVQLPPSGQPMIFLRDHPTTGGYPVVAVLQTDSIDSAAQLRPGDSLLFKVSDDI